MQGVVQQIVSGLATGGVYASLALALVLIYRSMEALNFAQGEMAMFSTFIAWELVAVVHLNYYAAFAITIAVSIVGGFVIERVVIRPVEKAPPLTVVLVTLGLFFVVNGLAGKIWGYVTQSFPGPPGFPQVAFNAGGVYLGVQNLFLIVVTIVLLGILYAFFQFTKLGLAMRSAALYPD